MEESFTFDEILERTTVVFSDNAIYEKGAITSWYRNVIKRCRFAGLDADFLALVKSGLDSWADFLSQDHVFTVPSLVREVERFQLMLDLDHLHYYEHEPMFTPEVRAAQEFVDVVHSHARVVDLVKESVFQPQDRDLYETIEHMVGTIAQHCHSKRSYGHRYEGVRKNGIDHGTDEQLVAAALYLSLFEDTDSGVLSVDSDLQRIFLDTHYFLAARYVLNRDEIRKLQKHPVHIYFVDEPFRAKEAVSSDTLGPKHHYHAEHLARSKHRQIMRSLVNIIS